MNGKTMKNIEDNFEIKDEYDFSKGVYEGDFMNLKKNLLR